MTKKMLIDATHTEETRVAVVNGQRLEEYDYENTLRKQLKGNIYLVKVTRVEPSLQAAFVDFGGNRHGFLPFPEIHPDYYRIPIADREALLAEERALAAEQAAREEAEDAAVLAAAGEDANPTSPEAAEVGHEALELALGSHIVVVDQETQEAPEELLPLSENVEKDEHADESFADSPSASDEGFLIAAEESLQPHSETPVEMIGGDVVDPPVFRSSLKRRYKIQEVIKRNQIMLIQISKEERGNKGAAVTSYISLPGRYCVLMPNSPRGGGVSRKVSNIKDRQRLKHILKELNVPEGMSVILRTAGVARSTAEIKRDLDYLLRLWDEIRELTLQSTAPALIYEEGNLVKRALRDLYRRDIDEVYVAGNMAYRTAQDFMRMLMPTHVDKVMHYADGDAPLFSRYQIETQIDAIHNPTVHLRSGGYIVINPTEAMVSIDVNSGRATKGRHIEETALKTNLEAAEEIARQLRLRDLGGLIVIDFIDMEDPKGNKIVEKRLREAMQGDRARIQLGRISAFGLLELSRQRLHPSLFETHFETCTHCAGTGLVRTVETSGVMLLRAIEEEAFKGRAAEIKVRAPAEVVLYIFNQKRTMLASIEKRHGLQVFLNADESLLKPNYVIDVARAVGAPVKEHNIHKPQPVQGVDMSDMPTYAEDAQSATQTEETSFQETSEMSAPVEQERGRGRRHRHPRRRQNHTRHDQTAEPVDNHISTADAPLEDKDNHHRRGGRRGNRRRGGRDRMDSASAHTQNDLIPGLGEQPSVLASVASSPVPSTVAVTSGTTMPEVMFTHRRSKTAEDQPPPPQPLEPLTGEGQEDSSAPKRKGWWKRLTE